MHQLNSEQIISLSQLSPVLHWRIVSTSGWIKLLHNYFGICRIRRRQNVHHCSNEYGTMLTPAQSYLFIIELFRPTENNCQTKINCDESVIRKCTLNRKLHDKIHWVHLKREKTFYRETNCAYVWFGATKLLALSKKRKRCSHWRISKR